MARSVATNRTTITDRNSNLSGLSNGLNFNIGHVSVSDDDAFNVGSALTIECWIFNNGTQNSFAELLKKDSQFILRFGTNGTKIESHLWTSDTSNKELISSNVIPTGQWNHLALTYGGTNSELWVNGVKDGTTALTGTISNASNSVTIGSNGSNGELFKGTMDELRISSSVRYTGTFTPTREPFTPDSDTVALYHFDETSGTTADNAEGTAALDGTLGGTFNPTWIKGRVYATGSNSRTAISTSRIIV